jgi:hypothetical protein
MYPKGNLILRMLVHFALEMLVVEVVMTMFWMSKKMIPIWIWLILKSKRATETGPLPTGDLLMNPKVMKDTTRDLEAFSPKMVSTTPIKCFVSVPENEKFPIVDDDDAILKKGDKVKEDARVIETGAA